MEPADYVSLEISKRDNEYCVEMVPGEPGLSIKTCENFGEVLSSILFYRGIMPENKGIRFGSRSMDHFDESQIQDLEDLADMHNQLVEIQKTFEAY